MPNVEGVITRKSMLYKTGVEYGDYTINHVQGCAHGCKYPCYAMMMAKRFGKVKTYDDWCEPKLAENKRQTLINRINERKNILEGELSKANEHEGENIDKVEQDLEELEAFINDYSNSNSDLYPNTAEDIYHIPFSSHTQPGPVPSSESAGCRPHRQTALPCQGSKPSLSPG